MCSKRAQRRSRKERETDEQWSLITKVIREKKRKIKRKRERERNKKEGKKRERIREMKGKYKKQVTSSADVPMLLISLRYQPVLKPHTADSKLHHPGNVNLGSSFKNAPLFFFGANGILNKVLSLCRHS